MESRMRDIVSFLVFGAFVWAAAVVGFVSLYIYAGDSILCGALADQDACARLGGGNRISATDFELRSLPRSAGEPCSRPFARRAGVNPPSRQRSRRRPAWGEAGEVIA